MRKKAPTNYRQKVGITLAEAKRIAIKRNGHLPRPGYETVVKSGPGWKVYLTNDAGRFRIWKYESP